ncbi:hypothetical protein IFM89_013340 [Coptis chinensis]|uniref:DNA-directed RNA polymerase RBP11-like dimerisation domain-containing protein n=1 Tax=Coptis chinensis TaxID=261450 RepID=A0A835HER4_9MAGN|nr:hypothetical protein IFM89_013340 [Coptis chinensis]
MEHGSINDVKSATFSLADEDHTLANSVRFTLNQDPRVTFCGYSIPHPTDAKVNIRVQTTEASIYCSEHLIVLVADQFHCNHEVVGFKPTSLVLGDPAKEVFTDALQDLIFMCGHVRETFDEAVDKCRKSNSGNAMDIKP